MDTTQRTAQTAEPFAARTMDRETLRRMYIGEHATLEHAARRVAWAFKREDEIDAFAHEILYSELGGANRLRAMINASTFDASDRALSFRIGMRARNRIKAIRVTLRSDDTYAIDYFRADASIAAGARLCNDCRRRGASFVGIGLFA